MKINKGFTLIELIVVIAIISLMAAAALAVLNPFAQFQKASDGRIKTDLAQIQKGLESYYQDNGKYPPVSSQCSYEVSGDNGDGNDCIEWGKGWQPYMTIMPKDPTSAHSYIYNVSADRQTYYLYANLTRGVKDPQSCSGGNACPNTPGNASCGTSAPCNFGLTSPNTTP